MFRAHRQRKASPRAATPEPPLMTVQEQKDKRTEILGQIMRDQWVDRPWDQPLSNFALHVVRSRGYARQEYIEQQLADLHKSIRIHHSSPLVAAEREKQQKSLLGTGCMIFKQFGIKYMAHKYCELNMAQRWWKFRFEELDIRFAKKEIPEAVYVKGAHDFYAMMVGFLNSYWDKLLEERVNLEYNKWHSSVRQSFREEKIPKDHLGREKVFVLEDGEWVLDLPENSPTKVVKCIMDMVDNCCKVPMSRTEDGASITTEWIQDACKKSSKIFGLTPEHRGEASPPEPATNPNDNDSHTEGGDSLPELEGEESPDEFEFEEQDPTLVSPPENSDRLRPAEPTRPRKNDERLPPLPNNEPWLKEWKDMSEAQRKSMKELHFGPNNKHYRPRPHWNAVLGNDPPPNDKSDNGQGSEPASQNKYFANNNRQVDSAAPPVNGLNSSEGAEPTDSTETTSSQQSENGASAAQTATEGGQPMQKTGSDAPLMIPANGNGGDDGSNPPKKNGSLPKGECAGPSRPKKKVTEPKRQPDEQGNAEDPSDDDMLSDVGDRFDADAESRVMNRETGALVQRSQLTPAPTRAPTIQEDTIFSAPMSPEPQRVPPTQSQAGRITNGRRGGFSDDPTVLRRQNPSFNTGGPWDINRAGFSMPANLPPGAGIAMRPPPNPDPLSEIQVPRRPNIGRRPENMNAWQNSLEGGREGVQARGKTREGERTASEIPGPSGIGSLPGTNGPTMQVQSMPDVSANQTQPASNPQRQNVLVLQGEPHQANSSHPTTHSSAPSRAGANGNLRGDMIYVPNGDGTLREAAPSRGVKRLRTTSLEVDPHRRPPAQGYGGIPMSQLRSYPGYNGMPQYPQYPQQTQQQGPYSGINGGRAQMHGNLSQRYQHPGNPGFANGFQNPQSMQDGRSMTGYNGFGYGGVEVAQTPSSGFWSRHSNMQSHEPSPFASEASLQNPFNQQYGGAIPAPNPYLSNENRWADAFNVPNGGVQTFPDANRPMTHQGLAQMGPDYQIGDERMMRSTNNPWNNVHPYNMQWPQIPQGNNGEQSQNSLHTFQIQPQNMGQMNPRMAGQPHSIVGNPIHPNGVLSIRAQPTSQEMSQAPVPNGLRPQSGPRNTTLNPPQANGTLTRQVQNAASHRPASSVPNGRQLNGTSAGHSQSGARPHSTSAALSNGQPNGPQATPSGFSSSNMGQANAPAPPKSRGRPPKDPAKKTQTQRPLQAPAQPQPAPPPLESPGSGTLDGFRRDQSIYYQPQPIQGTNGFLDGRPLAVQNPELWLRSHPVQQPASGPVLTYTPAMLDPRRQPLDVMLPSMGSEEEEVYSPPPQQTPAQRDPSPPPPPSQYVNGVNLDAFFNEIIHGLFSDGEDENGNKES
ncbi:hypothetical protein BGZ57DRAFT_956963 [Hyaloscypha finlandica]|nr:hypothetical protein BGZ57DRAFT_956963 [Hyaloscypha finlandica]